VEAVTHADDEYLQHVVFGDEFANAVGRTVARLPGYAGLVDEDDHTLTVFATYSELKHVAAALESAVGPPEGRYRLIPVRHALAELEALQYNMPSDAELEAAGIELASWGADPRSNTLRVKVLGDPTAAREYLEERFGRGLFTVVHTPYRMQAL
jgi:hypothetical protein